LRRSMAPRTAALVLCCLVLTAMVPTGAVAGSSCYKFSDSEQAFAKKTNAARRDAGKPKLTLDPHLSKVATKHTRAMRSKNKLFHTPSDKLARRVTNWTMLGENVGYGGSVSSLQKAFMSSSGHRANILDGSYKYLGVGTAKRNGVLWVTVIFESKSNPGTTLNMPSC
jgi:uncharacterized protein YkwD